MMVAAQLTAPSGQVLVAQHLLVTEARKHGTMVIDNAAVVAAAMRARASSSSEDNSDDDDSVNSASTSGLVADGGSGSVRRRVSSLNVEALRKKMHKKDKKEKNEDKKEKKQKKEKKEKKAKRRPSKDEADSTTLQDSSDSDSDSSDSSNDSGGNLGNKKPLWMQMVEFLNAAAAVVEADFEQFFAHAKENNVEDILHEQARIAWAVAHGAVREFTLVRDRVDQPIGLMGVIRVR
jgi:hypothetical protein